MKPILIAGGAVLLAVALVVIIIGMVWVARGEKGTWDIWPVYAIHGIAGLMALTCFYLAWRKNEVGAARDSREEIVG